MGRGRAKAKQQKVARRLKYSSGGTDLDRLRSELGVAEDEGGSSADDPYYDDSSDDGLVDRYADLADKYSDDDREDESENARRR
ncbi:DUF3073 domain-containing protein [Allonocardiopsis opalescens]|uniref:DUF3073 family protein n=1 Tax=Allonocardiopsis opalescens TaxID=1144618 RepID=A0A2T0QAQ4_9ACTN|nr:DUF3073 domain-containing protein [Allonocardiopsis opalescens]PRY00923.1 Protein of unknown function (DUF3073) [Allonocardiopsis opalescens]